MIYSKVEENNYNLHTIKTDKFKTITVKFNFKRPLVKEEITKRNLLVNCLLEGTKKYPTKRLLEIQTEELYDLGYRVVNYATGKFTVLSFEMTFINPKYTESGMDEKSFEFFSDLIYGVNVVNNEIAPKNFELSYNVMKDFLTTLKEDTIQYSQIRMLEEMNEPFVSYRNSGYLDDLDKITAQDLYSYYLDVINNDIVDIFILGDISTDESKDLLDKYFKINTNIKSHESHFYEHSNINDEIKFVKEKAEKEQSTLVVGFRMNDLTEFEKRYVLSIYNYILGGSTESNLFKTVREENSLCYYITSSSQPLLNIGFIRSGINAVDYEATISLINQELNNMREGIFDDKKIDNAKTTYISGLTELEDNPESIIGIYTSIEYLDSDDIETRKLKIMEVTKDDVVNLANKIHLNMIYLLEGCDTHAEE